MSQTDKILAGIGVALQLCLLVTLLRGAHNKRFPAFFSLTMLAIASTIALFATRNMPVAYYWTYWISEGFNTVFIFLAIDEIFRAVFVSFYRMPWFRWLFPGVGLLLLMIASLRSALHPMRAATRISAIIVSLEIIVGFLQMGIFGLLLAIARFFRVRYRPYTFGLALGFGLVSGGWLIAYLLRSEFGTQFDKVVRIVTPASYNLGLVVWLATFLARQSETVQSGANAGFTPEQMISDLKRYTALAKKVFKN